MDHAEDEEAGGTLEGELHQQQLETDTRPHTDLGELSRRAARVATSGRRPPLAPVGARVAALATSPLPVTPRTTPKDRYLRMAEQFGLTHAEQLTCGCHVHVSVESAEEGVAVLDRIRVWLPVLTALSANSPYWQGQDTRLRELPVTGLGPVALGRPDRGAGLGAALPGAGVRPARDGRPAG